MQTYIFTAGIILILLILSGWLYFSIKRDGRANPLDLVTETNGKLSITRIGQLCGLVISSWVVIKLASAGTLNYDIFLIYLTYVAASDGFMAFLRFRIRAEEEKTNRVEQEVKLSNSNGKQVTTTTTTAVTPAAKTTPLD